MPNKKTPLTKTAMATKAKLVLTMVLKQMFVILKSAFLPTLLLCQVWFRRGMNSHNPCGSGWISMVGEMIMINVGLNDQVNSSHMTSHPA